MRKKVFIFLIIWFIPVFLMAAESDEMTLTVTPTLIKNNITPGDIWKSSLKVINNNASPVDVAVQVRDFKSGTETGQIEFIDPQVSAADKEGVVYMSNWIKLDDKTFTLKPFESREVPFVIVVPTGAQPGGHYAAISVGTQPPKAEVGGTNIKISSSIASLIFLRVKGDVTEKGIVREFSTTQEFYQDANVNFVVRFENKGNTHILPQGEIRVKNIFGSVSDPIKINQQTEFGNVLPNDIRRWEFKWNAGDNWWNMGRYRADLMLTYGEQSKETAGQYFYFWIIKWKPLAIIIGSLLFLVIFFIYIVRRYIRQAVLSAQGSIVHEQVQNNTVSVQPRPQTDSQSPTVVRSRGVIDLKEKLKK